MRPDDGCEDTVIRIRSMGSDRAGSPAKNSPQAPWDYMRRFRTSPKSRRPHRPNQPRLCKRRKLPGLEESVSSAASGPAPAPWLSGSGNTKWPPQGRTFKAYSPLQTRSARRVRVALMPLMLLKQQCASMYSVAQGGFWPQMKSAISRRLRAS